ncbi:TetR/AcrR family transcriptional regulator [Bradyrhizobium sp. STM 3809]|uniref:TetR/AcrR family transcriptional regulator n=1 Tax=Bradyrhizobium sp. STM 3809 TaxID=551936 RepID=UPI0002409D3B|nr:TetR/AcrR family transcriptional regulator [Bradyrhizobium sp. STM 3809]CCE01709.1 Transcriptional regulator, TetR family [Bradyrhizobium sp. STM 3809]
MNAGRPREFDIDQALERALGVFWQRGYEGTSMADLTEALGITRASLYAAFGNKEGLFRRVMDCYEARAGGYRKAAEAAPTALEAVRLLLNGPVELHGNRHNPPGCLGVQGALACGVESEAVRNDLAARRGRGEAAIKNRLRRAAKEGDLATDEDPADLARYLSALIYGMAVLSAGGATRKQLQGVADVALRHWPKPDAKR